MGFLSSLFGGAPKPEKPSNRLANIKTVATDSSEHSILISVDAPDAATFGALMPTIVTAFLNQRMISPPDTSFLLITIIGSVSAAEFKQLWNERASGDQMVTSFLSRMTKADVLHGTADGVPLDSVSLLN